MERTTTKTFGAKASRALLSYSVIFPALVSQGFSLGKFYIRYYSLTMLSAIVVGYFIGLWRAKKENLSVKTFDDIVFWSVIVAFLSARLYYVIFYNQYYRADFIEIFEIWHGGLAIYGGLIGGLGTLIFFSRRLKIPLLKLTDIFAFALPVAQAIGRFGNYFNYEAFGTPTNLPWKMFVPLQFRPAGYEAYSYFQPTFLYEAVWDVLVFLALLFISKFFLAKKVKSTGYISAFYLLFYSFGRFFIEGIRLDSAYIFGFKIDQIIALLMILLASAIMFKAYNGNAYESPEN